MGPPRSLFTMSVGLKRLPRRLLLNAFEADTAGLVPAETGS